MNYASINKADVANGPGVRVSLFVSGCRHHCPGCFNQIAWDFGYGTEFTKNTVDEIMEAINHDYISGITVLGGEPFEPENLSTVKALCQEIKERYPDKSIWVYTGLQYEDVEEASAMKYIDVLVDGPFIQSLKDLTLSFRGSKNQRIIDVRKTRESGTIKLYIEE